MARDAAQLANPIVDFAPFDNDGNGFVDAFIVIHAGEGAEETGNANHIWSHKWVLPDGAFNADGTKIFGYLTVPEDCRIGVCAHELGHLVFGWPDLYDTDESSEGLGNWCLMAGGSWNGNGDIPAHPSAWCKVGQGWVSVVNRTSNAQSHDRGCQDQQECPEALEERRGERRTLPRGTPAAERATTVSCPEKGCWSITSTMPIDGNDNEDHPQVKLHGGRQPGTSAQRPEPRRRRRSVSRTRGEQNVRQGVESALQDRTPDWTPALRSPTSKSPAPKSRPRFR